MWLAMAASAAPCGTCPTASSSPRSAGRSCNWSGTLGLKLFERAPFRLTPAGAELYAFVQPFFGNLAAVEARIRARTESQLRIGAPEPALRDHLMAILRGVRRSFPKLRLSLRSGYQPQLEGWLEAGEIDLAITAIGRRPSARLRCQPLVRLPLVLLVPRRSPLRSATELWSRKHIDEPLITLPPTESICRHFQQELKRRRIDWPPAIIASSLELVTRYVADGAGLGASLDVPRTKWHPRVRVLPLEGFKPVEIVALWTGQPSPLVQSVLQEIQAYVRRKLSATGTA